MPAPFLVTCFACLFPPPALFLSASGLFFFRSLRSPYPGSVPLDTFGAFDHLPRLACSSPSEPLSLFFCRLLLSAVVCTYLSTPARLSPCSRFFAFFALSPTVVLRFLCTASPSVFACMVTGFFPAWSSRFAVFMPSSSVLLSALPLPPFLLCASRMEPPPCPCYPPRPLRLGRFSLFRLWRGRSVHVLVRFLLFLPSAAPQRPSSLLRLFSTLFPLCPLPRSCCFALLSFGLFAAVDFLLLVPPGLPWSLSLRALMPFFAFFFVPFWPFGFLPPLAVSLFAIHSGSGLTFLLLLLYPLFSRLKVLFLRCFFCPAGLGRPAFRLFSPPSAAGHRAR